MVEAPLDTRADRGERFGRRATVTNHFDTGAALLFAILALWQIPHFYSITIYRFNDYIAASIPTLPEKKGMRGTKVRMLLHIAAFAVVAVMPTVFGFTGYAYAAVVAVLVLAWLGLCVKGFWAVDPKRWARQMFLVSLVVIMGLCITMVMDVVR